VVTDDRWGLADPGADLPRTGRAVGEHVEDPDAFGVGKRPDDLHVHECSLSCGEYGKFQKLLGHSCLPGAIFKQIHLAIGKKSSSFRRFVLQSQ
jgi:hypothetical protein